MKHADSGRKSSKHRASDGGAAGGRPEEPAENGKRARPKESAGKDTESRAEELAENRRRARPKEAAGKGTGSGAKSRNKEIILNTKIKDSGSKLIFDNHILCSQFLRDYIDLPHFKDILPEDIEDVSEQYVPLFAEERNSDRVKRVNIRGKSPFFLISLIEHKTQTDYNVCMQIFRYMVYIWDAYEREAERRHSGISRQAGFQYPPILPIVYYEGKSAWTVPLDFRSRICRGEEFGKYIPDFRYYLVPLRDYSNEELMAKKDEISLVMIINKMQTEEDINDFRRLPADRIDAMMQDTPGYLVELIADILMAFLLKVNVPVPEAEELTDKVREKKMAQLFENMDKIDIQAERRKTERQRKKTEAERRRTEAERRKAEAEKQRAEAEKQRAETEKQRAETEKQRADRAERQAVDAGVKALVESYQELGAAKESALNRIMEKYKVGQKQASEKLSLYWKE